MKNKNIKKWVFNKRKSITDIFNGRPSSDEVLTNNMDQDSIMTNLTPNLPPSRPVPQKSVFLADGSPFRIDPRYSYCRTLGHGAYGVVCEAADAVHQRKVAVKKVTAVFEDLTDAKRIIREIRLLGEMKHENILTILDIDEPEHYESFADIYLVTELMDSDLHKLLRSSHALLDSQRKYFAYQMLRALKYIHSANILHRDLKPANVLVSASCDLKICDFGLARYLDPNDAAAQGMTEYVVTRWYRAPELLLSCEEYDAAIDMWSVGCVIAELYSRKPIFPGKDVKNQLEIICAVVGKPTSDDLHFVTNRKARDFLMRLPSAHRQDFRKLLPGACPAVVDLVDRLLQFDPRKRLSAAQALSHPYVCDYRDVDSETTAHHIDNKSLEPPSEDKLGIEGIRRLMWNEMLKFHPEARFREPQCAKEAERKLKYLMSAL